MKKNMLSRVLTLALAALLALSLFACGKKSDDNPTGSPVPHPIRSASAAMRTMHP